MKRNRSQNGKRFFEGEKVSWVAYYIISWRGYSMWYFLFPALWLLNLNWISPNSKMLPMMCWWCCKLCLFWWWWLFLWSGFVMEEHETIAEGSHQWTSTDFEIHPIWMKLCSIDTYYNMVPQQISQFLSGFKVTRRIFTDFKLVNFPFLI